MTGYTPNTGTIEELTTVLDKAFSGLSVQVTLAGGPTVTYTDGPTEEAVYEVIAGRLIDGRTIGLYRLRSEAAEVIIAARIAAVAPRTRIRDEDGYFTQASLTARQVARLGLEDVLPYGAAVSLAAEYIFDRTEFAR